MLNITGNNVVITDAEASNDRATYESTDETMWVEQEDGQYDTVSLGSLPANRDRATVHTMLVNNDDEILVIITNVTTTEEPEEPEEPTEGEPATITLADLDNGPARTSDTYDATGFEEDQIVIYTYSEDTNEIQDVYAAELLEGEVTSVRSETEDGVAGNGDQFIVDGTTYKYNMTVSGSERLKAEAVSNDVVAYLDANGYVAYIDESAITYDYAYVLSMGNDDDRYGTDGTKGSTYYARLILTDVTMVKVETDATSKEAPGLKNQLVS